MVKGSRDGCSPLRGRGGCLIGILAILRKLSQKVTTLKSSVDQESFSSKKKFTAKKVPKNKVHCLLADPAKNDIPKNRLRKVKLKKVIDAFFGFRQIPSHAKGADKTGKVLSLGRSS